jgi:hypothetical protein
MLVPLLQLFRLYSRSLQQKKLLARPVVPLV